MARPRARQLDEDSKLLLRQLCDSLAIDDIEGLNAAELRRAMRGVAISEQARIRLEQHLLVCLHFKDRPHEVNDDGPASRQRTGP
jgi:hypothetical protein